MSRPRSVLSAAALAAVLFAAGPAAADEDVPRYTGNGEIRGEVTGEKGEPLVGISIVLTPVGRKDIVFATSTDEDGRYALDSLVPADYVVAAHGQGVQSVVKSGVRVKPPFRAIIDIQMEPVEDASDASLHAAIAAAPDVGSDRSSTEGNGRLVRLTGSFVDADQQPVLEGAITLRRIGHAEDVFYAETDESGRFSISDLPGGVYDITTRSPGLIPLHLREQALPPQVSMHLELLAPDYPLSFRGYLDDLLPEEVPMPPPSPREIDVFAGSPPADAPADPAIEPAPETPEPTPADPNPGRTQGSCGKQGR